MVEDRGFTPAAMAASRIDFADWLSRLNHRNQRVATTLATGETTRTAARLIGISDGRRSLIRTELRELGEVPGEPSDVAGELAMAGC